MKETGFAIINKKNEIVKVVLTRKEANNILENNSDYSFKLVVIMDL